MLCKCLGLYGNYQREVRGIRLVLYACRMGVEDCVVMVSKKYVGRWYIYVHSRLQPQATNGEAAELASNARFVM